jgi:hypothetical protein
VNVQCICYCTLLAALIKFEAFIIIQPSLGINLCQLFGSEDTPIQELTTSDGTSIWAGDGVHLTSPAYRVAARLLMAELENAGVAEECKPKHKRARLESVVPVPAKEAGSTAATGHAKADGDASVAVRPAPTIHQLPLLQPPPT